jgi:hypothetical protein
MASSDFVTGDPRTIITPDAFAVSPGLVGIPLASPLRRLVAITIDLVFVAAFSFLGWYLLGLTVVIGAFRAATRKPGESASAEAGRGVYKAFRIILGCFGTFVLMVIIMAVVAVFIVNDSDLSDTLEDLSQGPVTVIDSEGEGAAGLGIGDLISGIGSVSALSQAGGPDEARGPLTELVRSLRESGAPREDILGVLEEFEPDGAEDWWPDLTREVVADVYPSEAEVAEAAEDPEPAPTDPAETGDEVATLAEQLAAYAALVESGEIEESPEAAEYRRAIVAVLGADTLAQLSDALEDTEGDLRRAQSRADAAETALEDAENSGILSTITDFAESTGLLFGWGTVYMSLFTAWWNGQTIGKRMLGIRVVRLDGKPMNGWMAFERAGGYAAGFATGLLGFAQVYWDPNRMAIHDKVTETAVIIDGAKPVPGPWSAKASAPTVDG